MERMLPMAAGAAAAACAPEDSLLAIPDERV
jgi:hypothetical protein